MQRLGPYELSERIAAGGMGSIYKARDPGTGRPVAIKVISARPGNDELLRRRFVKEGEALARLRHPSIVAVHAAAFADRTPYLVLDYVQGQTLAQRLHEQGPYEPQAAARLILTLAEALTHAHQQGILHRDLKTDNIMLRADGAPMLVDFGLAKDLSATGSQLSQTGRFLGTPGYWPPEQARGRVDEIGPHSDVYGLGATLYAVLTGRAPFEGSLIELVVAAEKERPVPPSELRAEVPSDLEAICLRCLEKKPSRRYADMGELADDLRAWLAGEPVSASKQNRQRILLSVAFLLAVLGLGGLALGSTIRVARKQKAFVRRVDDAVRAATVRLEGAPGRDAGELDALLDLEPELVETDPRRPLISALVGGLALRSGRLDLARKRLADLEGVDPPAGDVGEQFTLRRLILAAELQLHGSEPAPDLRRELHSAVRRYPLRDDLRLLLAEYALARGRGDEAATMLETLGERAPGWLRFEVALHQDKLQLARHHLADARTPESADRLRLRLARLALLNRNLKAAQELLAGLSPSSVGDPLREELAADARREAATALRAVQRSSGRPDPKLIVDLVNSYRILSCLTQLSEAELGRIEAHIMVSTRDLEVAATALEIDPDRPGFLRIYCSLAAASGARTAERALPTLRHALDRAFAIGDMGWAVESAWYLVEALGYTLRHDEMKAVLGRVEPHAADYPARVSRVRVVCADSLFGAGRIEEGLSLLDTALANGTGTSRDWIHKLLGELQRCERDRSSLDPALECARSFLEREPSRLSYPELLDRPVVQLGAALVKAGRSRDALALLGDLLRHFAGGLAYTASMELELRLEAGETGPSIRAGIERFAKQSRGISLHDGIYLRRKESARRCVSEFDSLYAQGRWADLRRSLRRYRMKIARAEQRQPR